MAGIQDDHVLDLLRHGGLHQPAAAHGVLVTLAGGAGRCGQSGQLKPRVIDQQSDKTLSNHASGANDAYLEFFHNNTVLSAPATDRPTGIHPCIPLLYAAANPLVTVFAAICLVVCFAAEPKFFFRQQKNRLENRHRMQYNSILHIAQRNMWFAHMTVPRLFDCGPRYDACRASPSAVCPFSAGYRPGRRIIPTDTHENRASVLGYIIALHKAIVNEKRGRNRC